MLTQNKSFIHTMIFKAYRQKKFIHHTSKTLNKRVYYPVLVVI